MSVLKFYPYFLPALFVLVYILLVCIWSIIFFSVRVCYHLDIIMFCDPHGYQTTEITYYSSSKMDWIRLYFLHFYTFPTQPTTSSLKLKSLQHYSSIHYLISKNHTTWYKAQVVAQHRPHSKKIQPLCTLIQHIGSGSRLVHTRYKSILMEVPY